MQPPDYTQDIAICKAHLEHLDDLIHGRCTSILGHYPFNEKRIKRIINEIRKRQSFFETHQLLIQLSLQENTIESLTDKISRLENHLPTIHKDLKYEKKRMIKRIHFYKTQRQSRQGIEDTKNILRQKVLQHLDERDEQLDKFDDKTFELYQFAHAFKRDTNILEHILWFKRFKYDCIITMAIAGLVTTAVSFILASTAIITTGVAFLIVGAVLALCGSFYLCLNAYQSHCLKRLEAAGAESPEELESNENTDKKSALARLNPVQVIKNKYAKRDSEAALAEVSKSQFGFFNKAKPALSLMKRSTQQLLRSA